MMAARIQEETIREVRERADIVEVVSSYLPLKRSGHNHLGLCPFHAEKTPSFNVNAARQIFHCFGCGVGGNVFSFLMRMEGLSFPEAVRRLGERVGVEVAEEALSPAEARRREEAGRLLRVNEVAAEFYHRLLLEAPEGAPGRRYLRQRGYDGETARRFRLGYAPGRWDALAEHLRGKGFDPQVARQLGLIRPGKEGRGDIDLFRRRLLFPIQGLQGEEIAFGGRVLDDSLPKYLNSPESPLYHKGRILYGLCQARDGMRQTGEGIVVEGYFDLLALDRAGFGNVVATCGTALTVEHARLLKRYAGKVLLLFDQDSAGRRATFRAMEVLLAEGLAAAVVELEAGEDPDSFLRRYGPEAFRARLAAARPVLEVFIEETLAVHGDGIEGRARAVEEILGKLRLLQGDVERSLYLKALAEQTGLDEALLRQKVSRSKPAPSAGPPAPRATVPSPPDRLQLPAEGLEEKSQDWLLVMMLTEPGLRQRVAAEGTENLFSNAARKAVAERILQVAGTSQEFDVGALFDPLSEEQKAVLSSILIKDEKAFAEDPEGTFEGCRQAAARVRLKKRSRELPALIRQAAAAGDWETHARYLREMSEINKRL